MTKTRKKNENLFMKWNTTTDFHVSNDYHPDSENVCEHGPPTMKVNERNIILYVLYILYVYINIFLLLRRRACVIRFPP